MKVGDLVKHRLFPVYGVGVVLKVYSFHLPADRAVVMFSEFMCKCKFISKDLEVIDESR
jgi:hypothetical protein